MLLPKPLFICLCICIITINVRAQSILNKPITVTIKQEKLSQALNIISKQGNFFFSYLSSILPQDSVVGITAKNIPVKQILEQLLGSDYVFKESGNYIVILRKSIGQNYYLVTGIVKDRSTGTRLANVSVYERQQLISTITNNEGYFRLRLKDKYPAAAISVSRDLYADTSLLLPAGKDQELELTIAPVTYQLKVVDVTGKHNLEKNWFAKVFISSRQKLTTLNIGGFLTDKPYQLSLTPGLGTHGKMSGQVVNKFSFNMIGGYAAGVDGVEVGTLFNMVKNDVKDVQVSGFINVVGGKVNGVQVGGFHNNVGDSLTGVQVAGFSDIIRGSMKGVQVTGVASTIYGNTNGVQLSGAFGIVKGSVNGMQVAGVFTTGPVDVSGAQVSGAFNLAKGNILGAQVSGAVNIADGNVSGTQISGLANIGKNNVNGAQIGLYNFAHRLKGVQIGIFNIADTSEGISLGLLSIVRKGYKKVDLFSTDILPFNIAWKSGNRTAYSILTGGINTKSQPLISAGYGIGNELLLKNQWTLNTELIYNTLFQVGSKSPAHLISLRPSFRWQWSKKLGLFAGPAFILSLPADESNWQYKSGYPNIRLGDKVSSWFGWQAGITLF
ncbi:hypothetical protein DVR12_21600 [Chitinophaga silvatica]|uniref:Carboxypeptidase-like regulatory domain-containing protein n=1 Tax=Chitinophaga silvatica TaxID=2282649 RepID=A0A3E1Y4Z3_9BACT|nr:STN domain-containing protein [Chitinophaga silvatica]RFS19702.1 hypothetical protein DVR12_21600 [Chitinophaga silvatica]